MQSLLIIGYQDYDENMYPHTYEVIRRWEKEYTITYYSCRNERGGLFLKSKFKSPINRLRQRSRIKHKLKLIKSEIQTLISTNRFDKCLAIDHFALFVLNDIQKQGIPFYFWSHDILLYDHPWYRYHPMIRTLVRQNREMLKHCKGIIIQDANRGVLLDSFYHTHKIDKLYLPISLNDSSISNSLDQNKKPVILQIGSLNEARGTIDLIEAMSSLDLKYFFRLKGSAGQKVRKLSNEKNIPLDSNVNDLDQLRTTVMSCDIGILSLTVKDTNNYFVEYASGQLVEFLMQGKPVIVHGMPRIIDKVEELCCGIGLKHIETKAIESCIRKIVEQYALYSYNARKTYLQYYNLENYIQKGQKLFG